MRRSVERADQVVLNLFCGPDPAWWTKRVPAGWVILNVDILQNHDTIMAQWHICGALSDLRNDVTSPSSSFGTDLPPSSFIEGFTLAPVLEVVVASELSAVSTTCGLPLPPPAVPEVILVDGAEVVLLS